MWNILMHFLTFTGGVSAGVVLMCLYRLENRRTKNLNNRKGTASGMNEGTTLLQD